MQFSAEADTFSARLSTLPVTEHAILLNRFKFLNLVQRVAAADVAEMIQTVGLEALLCKDSVAKIPLLQMDGETERCRVTRSTTAKQSGAERRGTLQKRVGNAVVVDERGGDHPRNRHRFSSSKREQEFVKRMSRPQKAWDPLERLMGKPQRNFVNEDKAYNHGKSATISRHVIGDAVSSGVSFPSRYSAGVSGGPDNCTTNADDDDVVVESSFDQPLTVGPPLKVQATDLAHDQSNWRPEQQLKPEEEVVKKTDDFLPQVGANRVDLFAEKSSLQTNADKPNTAANSYGNAAQVPQTAQNSGLRVRGSFAPKAKPKAAAEVSRVPLEVVRHASALLASRRDAPAPPQPALQFFSPVAPNNLSVEGQSVPAPVLTSHSLLLTSGLDSSKQGDSDAQHGNTPVCTATQPTLSESALAELALSVERMLQDHQSILDGIVRSGVCSSAKPLTNQALTAEKALQDEVVAYNSDNDRRHKVFSARGASAGVKSTRLVSNVDDVLEDTSEEDEVLLVSRIQRKLGLIDREMTTIEQREGQSPQKDGNSNIEKKNDKKELPSKKVVLQKGQGRRKVIINTNEAPSKGSTGIYGLRRGRPRGGMPRSIVERICSFQKENREYIRYTEKQWNTSHITEQVFAQRLTETLLEDAFNEVLEEVGGILDTYVEGLTLHELQ